MSGRPQRLPDILTAELDELLVNAGGASTTRDRPAFLGEHALNLPFGGPGALAAQLQHLLDAVARGVNLHIVPKCAHAHLLHSWLLIEYRDNSPVVHVELTRSVVNLHNREVEPYLYDRRELRELALSRAESQIMIKEMLNRDMAEEQLKQHRWPMRRGARVTG